MRKIWKQRYQIVEEVGKGGNGKVYKVWDIHLEKEWAMKILEEKVNGSINSGDKADMDELTALKRISHPNFPRIVDAFEEEGRNILIMDYIHGITLEEVIGKGPVREEEMVWILLQICDAILYLHQNNPVLLYLDLKPSNIMIEESRIVKLVDLGSVSIKGKRGKISGSFGYASPEQIKVQREGICLTEQSDIFSLGMVLYAMATGSSTKLPVMEAKSRHGVFIRRENPFLSIPLEKIIEKCTRGNCNRRYGSLREVKKDLEIWEKYLNKKKHWYVPRISLPMARKQFWYQEKSIFCTEGKHSFYIAKKILAFLLCVWCLVPGKDILAGEKSGEFHQEEKMIEVLNKDEVLHDFEKLEVIIRDFKLRKVLVKEGCAYETSSNILLEIPWEEIEGEECQIVMECKDGGREKKRFYLECIYVK